MVAIVVFLLIYYFGWARRSFQGPQVQGGEEELTEIEREFEEAARGSWRRRSQRRAHPQRAGREQPAGPPFPHRFAGGDHRMSTEHGGDSHPKRAWLEGLIQRRQRRHAGRGADRHAGTPDGQARPGAGLPGRRHRPRRPLLHVPAGHRHGDEHARRVRADELGDRLRRLDRGPGVGHLCGSCRGWRRRPSCCPTRSTITATRSRSRPEPCSSASWNVPPKLGFDAKAGSEFEYYLLTDTYEQACAQGLRRPRAVRLLQRGLPPAAGHEGRADPRPSCAT